MHPSSAYQIVVARKFDPVSTAQAVFQQTFRTTFDQPGFSLLSFRMPIKSEELRACMAVLKQQLDGLLHARTGRHLIYQSMARFDQQNTTKFHLDGAPPGAFLMLGYEASEVSSALAMADFTLASWKLGITPSAFVRDHNPMYASGAKLLEGTITPLAAFDHRRDNILVINNSCLPFDPHGQNLLGVMHQATMVPNASKCRIINSTMLHVSATLADEALTPAQQQDYVMTTHISGPSVC